MTRFCILSLISLLLAGCGTRKISVREDRLLEGSRVATRAEYSKLQEGMTQAEVNNIIGSGGVLQTGSDTYEQYNWTNRDGSKIILVFRSGRVSRKAWYKPARRLRLP
jgi:outer membrane protein assembly factor BamE (lipoprotein component of BamABCDE complex)